MGSIELHAEYDDGDRFRYVGVRRGEKNYALFAVLGDPVFKRYAEADDGGTLPRLKSTGGLPHDVCDEIEARASELGADDEISCRWIWFEKLDAPWWKQVPDGDASYVHGPRDYAVFRKEGRICTESRYDDQKKKYLDSSGFRLVTATEMEALIASNPSLVDDRHQAAGKVYTLVQPTAQNTWAERLGFSETLSWLGREAGRGSLRVVFFIEA